ncbi:carboxypeptidase-like regulatory domain-containing protein, partial [Candidatus Micrarchaeota archaeon]|nr:carboxypeptidase-like regulatory domain-containing protein [Candidatus Micrarchaeota archaeon]
MADGANGIYASLEEKWYNLLDKVNGAGIPIYKLIDPIDNVVPSFALFLGIAALLVLGAIAMLFLSSPAQGTADLTVMVEDEQGRAVKGVNVEISGPAGIMLDRKTANNGEALFEDLPAGEYTASAGKEGYDDAGKKISIGTEDLSETIVIYKTVEPPPPPGEEEEVTLSFVGPDGKKVVGTTLWLNIACSSGVKPRKRSYSTDTGEVVVSV